MSMVHNGMIIARSRPEDARWAERDVREFARTEHSNGQALLASGPAYSGAVESKQLRPYAAPDMAVAARPRGNIAIVSVLSITKLMRRVLPRAGSDGGR